MCDSPGEAQAARGVPSQAEIEAQVKKGVDDVKKNRGPKWKFDYTGDLEGSVQGNVLSTVGTGGSYAVAGGGVSREGKSAAHLRIHLMGMNAAPYVLMFSLALDDGTQCGSMTDSTVNIMSREKKAFRADFTGKLDCAGRSISVNGTVNENP
jgi:hypothetical protein